jgi:peptidoglycan/LPS O-acetylase OafA/YrhL
VSNRGSPFDVQHLIYRPDIDGLRAVSIIAVILFHAELATFSGGYVGVDIFFVISGFLITNLIVEEIDRGIFAVASFYERRIRRLLPAAALMIVVCAIFASIFFPPREFEKFCKSLLSFVFFSSNWYFMKDVAYFDIAATKKVLLHTWSLSVEEQFYLGFPFLMLALANNRRRTIVLFALFAISFTYAQGYWIGSRRGTVFFDSICRFWEPLTGCFAALICRRWQAGLLESILLRGSGIVMIGCAVLIYDGESGSSPIRLLVPCVGAAMLLLAHPHQADPLRIMLASAPFRWVGQLSYSIYLWHWPVFCFARIYFDGLSLPVVTGCVALTVLVSVVSFFTFENPIRKKRMLTGKWKPFALLSGTSVVYAGFAIIGIATAGLPQRLPSTAEAAAAGATDEDIRFVECFSPTGYIDLLVDQARKNSLCVIGDSAKPHIDYIVWGDSHAYALLPALDGLGRSHGLRGVFAGYSSCPPLAGTSVAMNNGYRCPEFFDAVLQLVKRENIRNVFLVARWSIYVFGIPPSGPEIATKPLLRFSVNRERESDSRVVFETSLDETLNQLFDRNVLIVKEVPMQKFDVPSALVGKIMLHQTADRLWTTRSQHEARQQYLSGVFDAAGLNGKVTVIDLASALCSEERCIVERAGIPLYRDNQHLNRTGALFMKPFLEPFFTQIESGR